MFEIEEPRILRMKNSISGKSRKNRGRNSSIIRRF